jgi:hypothetical protein
MAASVCACGGDSVPSRTDSAAGAAAAAPPPASETSPTRAAVDACAEIASVASRLRGAEVSQMADSFPAFTGQARRYGCVLNVAGPTSAAAPVPVLATTLPDSLGAAWQRDSALVADGPSETVYGTWRGDVLCLVRTGWSAGRYASTIGCEQLPGRVPPRS